jgi:hypothetical protein
MRTVARIWEASGRFVTISARVVQRRTSITPKGFVYHLRFGHGVV